MSQIAEFINSSPDPFMGWVSFILGGMLLFAILWGWLVAGPQRNKAEHKRQRVYNKCVRHNVARVEFIERNRCHWTPECQDVYDDMVREGEQLERQLEALGGHTSL